MYFIYILGMKSRNHWSRSFHLCPLFLSEQYLTHLLQNCRINSHQRCYCQCTALGFLRIYHMPRVLKERQRIVDGMTSLKGRGDDTSCDPHTCLLLWLFSPLLLLWIAFVVTSCQFSTNYHMRLHTFIHTFQFLSLRLFLPPLGHPKWDVLAIWLFSLFIAFVHVIHWFTSICYNKTHFLYC